MLRETSADGDGKDIVSTNVFVSSASAFLFIDIVVAYGAIKGRNRDFIVGGRHGLTIASDKGTGIEVPNSISFVGEGRITNVADAVADVTDLGRIVLGGDAVPKKAENRVSSL